MRRFPLLEVSAVAVDLAGQGDALTIDDISAIIAANKTLAKRAVDKVRLVTVSPRGSEGAQNEISAALPNIPQMISK
jgi:long-subunit fatty acid transport protein